MSDLLKFDPKKVCLAYLRTMYSNKKYSVKTMSLKNTKTKRLKLEALNFRPKDGTKAKIEWLAKRENRNLTNWLETTVDRLYAEAGGPPIEPKTETDQEEVPSVLIRRGRHAFPPDADSDD
ncbi:hypothetical protein [Methylocaldum sp.]|uniref:hypothetical protein n=1 Tax=Methylocaldum sp. TaxID=1969727 RepID=UPI002D2AC921|nr:hypothetical protein [Methylocaldum sp.]HYE35664.1 hypothetical protein [Methylocaldum sp.]